MNQSAPVSRWLVPLIVVIVIVGLVSWRLSIPPSSTGSGPSGGETGRGGGMQMPPNTTALAAELRGHYASLFETLNATLTGVTDATTAQAALPELQKTSEQLDVRDAALKRLPAGLQTAVVKAFEESSKAFQAQADQVLALPGVGDVLKETIDVILSKLPRSGTGGQE